MFSLYDLVLRGVFSYSLPSVVCFFKTDRSKFIIQQEFALVKYIILWYPIIKAYKLEGIMNQEDLMAFLMIVNCKSISLAAEKLYISQPALSNRLRSLEEKLGYPLIHRKKGGHYLMLTDEGKAFIPIARKSQELWMSAKTIPEQMNQNALRVLSISSISSYVLPNVIKSYLERGKESSLRVLTSHSESAYKSVEDGSADLALITPDVYGDTLETSPAYRTKMVCVSGSKSGFSSTVDITTLIPENEIQVPWFPDYDNWRANTVPLVSRPHILVGSMGLMESLINDEYWCLMPSTIAHRLHRKDVIISALYNPPPDQYVFYLKRQGPMSDSMRAFLECLHTELSSIEGTTSYLKNI